MSDMKTHRNRFTSKNNGDNKLNLNDDKIEKMRMKTINNTATDKGRGKKMSNDKRKLFLIFFGVALIMYKTYKVFFDENLQVTQTKNKDSMNIIKNTYADIIGLDDLKKRSEKIKELCYVSYEMMHI